MQRPGLTSFLGVGLAIFAAMACSPAPSPGTDGGTASDGGSGHAIGGECRQNSDCASQNCDTGFTGGYCVASCDNNGSCPANSTCETSPDGQQLCLASCTKNSDCRLGYTCDGSLKVCLPAGSSGRDGGTAGYPDGGSTMHGNSDLGGACSAAADCVQGTSPECLGTPGGYCTSTCNTDTDCGSNGTCLGLPDGMGGTKNLCLENCTTDANCGRQGYVCVPLQAPGGPGVCFPACTSNMDCGTGYMCDSSSGQCVASTTPPGGYPGYPATFPTPPQVGFQGGQVMATPKFVPIFFSSEDPTYLNDMKDFYSKLGGSTYWAAAKEYGVGAATSVAPIVLSERAATTVDDSYQNSTLQQWLDSEIRSGKVPRPDQNTIYAIHYPSGTTVTDGSGQSCQAFDGYHSEMQLSDGSVVPYAVIPTCPPIQGFTAEQMATSAVSHELIEASTDPFTGSSPGWVGTDAVDAYWMIFDPGGEIGDMCEEDPEAYSEFQDLPYAVQRFWSNSAVKAGHDPCVPMFPGEIFFNSVPELSDTFAITANNQRATVHGVRIAVGQSKTIPVDLYSDAPTGSPWTVEVHDMSWLMGGQPTISFTLDKTTGQNGDKLMLTIKPMQAGQSGYDLFFVVSTLGTGQNQVMHIWPGIIAD